MKISQKRKVGTYTLSHKVSHLMVVNNFGKYRSIFKILSPIDSEENSLCRPITTKISTSRAIGCYTTLWKSKIQKKCYWFWQHPQQTADTFVVTLWTFDLTFNSSQCLKLDCWHWLTDWSSSDDVLNQSTVERCSVERYCIMNLFHHDYLCTVFVLSRLYFNVAFWGQVT